MKPIPDYGDKFTISEFIAYCQLGTFVDNDGIGYYATENGMSELPAYPSSIRMNGPAPNWTHVIWFNK